MEYVFLFSGQGSQFKGMAEDICKEYPAARAIIDEMSAASGEDIGCVSAFGFADTEEEAFCCLSVTRV